MNFPQTRLRRLRGSTHIRELFQDIYLQKESLIQPLFISDLPLDTEPPDSLPKSAQINIKNLPYEFPKFLRAGINKFILFGVTEKKDTSGSISRTNESVVVKAIKEIKKNHNNVYLIADVCHCQYTDHGHCGIITDNSVNNDKTNKILAQQSLILANAGADALAPSDMMDGRVRVIRERLDLNDFNDVPIFSYSVKYASNFYGPFRSAANIKDANINRKSYQMNTRNSYNYINEIKQDLHEGADAVIIKPALSYLDIITNVKREFNVPVIAYSVSGEYAMIKAAAQKNWINEESIVLETAYSMVRSGASAIISYYCLEITKLLNE